MRARFLAGIAVAVLSTAVIGKDLPIDLDVKRLALAEGLADGERLQGMRILGMLELPTTTLGAMRLSQLSGLAWDDDEGILYALSDRGWLFHLEPHFTDGMLTGLSLHRAEVLTDPAHGKPLRRWLADAEGLDILNGRNGKRDDAELLVSFEHTPRVLRYRPDGRAIGALDLPAPIDDAKSFAAPNQMLESVCVDPALGVVVAPEAPLKGEPAGTTRLFALFGKAWHYPVTGRYRITAIECLGNRNLLVLERDFGNLLGSNRVRLRRVTLPRIPTSSLLRAATLVTLDSASGHRVDNFEGMARHRGRRFFLVSDDNDLFVQRTLLLYVEIDD